MVDALPPLGYVFSDTPADYQVTRDGKCYLAWDGVGWKHIDTTSPVLPPKCRWLAVDDAFYIERKRLAAEYMAATTDEARWAIWLETVKLFRGQEPR